MGMRVTNTLLVPGKSVLVQASQHFSDAAGRGEQSFKQKLTASNFHVQEINNSFLHNEYSDGQYQVLRVCKLGT